MRVRPLRLAFGCEARVGKDTACDYLIKSIPLKVPGGETPIRLSFAGALYDILYHAQKVCGFPLGKDRKFLQFVGTEWARAQDPKVWINIVKRRIEEMPANVPIIITDVRFQNEAEMLSHLGFQLIRIKRDPIHRTEILNTNHSSETALLDYKWDLVLKNNHSLEDFYNKLDVLIASEC